MSSVDDPFAALPEKTETAAPKTAKKEAMAKTATKEKAEPKDDAPFDGMSYFATEMVIEEDEYVLPEATFGGPYIKPKEFSYIPVRIISAVVEERTQKQMIVGFNKDKTERTTDPKRIEELLEKGGSQEIEEEVPYFQFKMEAEHVSQIYGKRFSPYWLFVSAFDQMIPLSEAKRTKDKLGWPKTSGRKLLTATRVGIDWAKENPDRPLTEDPELLQEVADKLVGKIVMVRVRYSKPKKTVDLKPRVNEDGSLVKARIDQKLGEYVKLAKTDEGGFVNVTSGEAYEGPTAGLITYGDEFLIPDGSDDGEVVTDQIERESVYDNLDENVSPVPHAVAPADQVSGEMASRFTIMDRADGKKIVQRLVVVHRNDGSKAPAEVTWETVGKIATQKKDVGAAIQAVTLNGEMITATWLGTQWQETPQPHRAELTELGEVRLVALPTASSSTTDFSGLDEFKGGD